MGEVETIEHTRDKALGIHNIDFVVTASDDASVSVTEDSRFLGPTP